MENNVIQSSSVNVLTPNCIIFQKNKMVIVALLVELDFITLHSWKVANFLYILVKGTELFNWKIKKIKFLTQNCSQRNYFNRSRYLLLFRLPSSGWGQYWGSLHAAVMVRGLAAEQGPGKVMVSGILESLVLVYSSDILNTYYIKVLRCLSESSIKQSNIGKQSIQLLII